MKKIIFVTWISIVVLLSSCASIMSKREYGVKVNSKPSQVSFVVYNEVGREVHRGVTPQVVVLSSSAGYFNGETYNLVFSHNGRKVEAWLESSLSGWYFGNILFGIFIGMLIVDPLTGSMYNLPENFDIDLNTGDQMTTKDPKSLQIVSIDNIPQEFRKNLVKVR